MPGLVEGIPGCDDGRARGNWGSGFLLLSCPFPPLGVLAGVWPNVARRNHWGGTNVIKIRAGSVALAGVGPGEKSGAGYFDDPQIARNAAPLTFFFLKGAGAVCHGYQNPGEYQLVSFSAAAVSRSG